MNKASPSPVAKPKIILDCDPGHDDAVAILLAARHTEICGITTVSGNAPLKNTTDNALLVCQLAEIEVGVYPGANAPLQVAAAHAGHVHGDTGLDGPKRPQLLREAASGQAVEFIIDTVRSTDDVWLVPIGPLTNIAKAFAAAEDIVEKVAGISLMGGSTTEGNVTATAEFNFWADPHAAAQVMESGVSTIKMAGLNLTHQLRVSKDTLNSLRQLGGPGGQAGGGRVADFVADLFDFYLSTNHTASGESDAPLHDPCAVLAITHPHLFEFARGHVSVATEDELTRGMSVWDRRPKPAAEPNCEIATTIDSAAALGLIVETLGAYS